MVISITIITLTIWNNHYLCFKEIHLVAAVGYCKELWAAGTLSFRSLTIEEYYHYYFMYNVYYIYNDDIQYTYITYYNWPLKKAYVFRLTDHCDHNTDHFQNYNISILITSIMSIPSHVYTHSWLSILLLPTIES